MNKLIAWFVHNPIAANLLMVLIAAGGLMSIPSLDKEFFPQRKVDTVVVSVSYPGAGPAEVEQQISMRIEEALDRVDGIERMVSTSVEGFGSVAAEVAEGFEALSVLNEIKSEVDGITTFPTESEQPQVSQQLWRSHVIRVSLAGDIGEANLKELALGIKDELSTLPQVQLVDVRGVRNFELAIEISETALQRYGLRFEDVANAVRSQSINLPAGKLKGADGDVLLQTRSQAFVGTDFEDIVLVRRTDGTRILLSDVATVKDGFEENELIRSFNGTPSIALDVSISTNPDISSTSNAVQNYVDELRPSLPSGVVVAAWQDMNVGFEGRAETLITNGVGGLILVFALLLLFLRPLLAMWVAIGIGVAFLGSFWFLPATGTSLNIISMFALILILGIVVDDAIIVGESVYGMQSSGYSGTEGAIRGASLVLKPVFFAVLTTMIVFGLFYMLPDDQPEPRHMASVVLLALTFSLIECLLILPSHLAHMKPEVRSEKPGLKQLDDLREFLSNWLANFVQQRFKPFLELCLRWRWLTLSVFIILFLVSAAIYGGGWVMRSFAPIVQSDFLVSNVELHEGTAFHRKKEIMAQIQTAADALRDEINAGSVQYIRHTETSTWDNTIYVAVELTNFDDIPYTNAVLVQKWRDYIGELSGIKEFSLRSEIVDMGKDLQLEVSAGSQQELEAVTGQAVAALRGYGDIRNVRSSLDNPRPEVVLSLKPEAQTLNFTEAELAQQVRQAFYGEEVQRIPRQREDVKVMVRYPREQRESLDSVLNMKLRTQDGMEIPFEAVANLEYQPGYTKIERIDRRKASRVTADLAPGGQAFQIVAQLYSKEFAEIQQNYPGVTIILKGEQDNAQEFEEAIGALIVATMILVYGVMAIVFHSYWQPFLIVTAIPFGLVGAIFGHILIGREVSMFSLMGILACAGVVVNDNLVLIDRINRYRDDGEDLWNSIVNGATDRFRAIILTSLTTFVGLMPIMLQRSVQAQFLIPMVAALAFGVLFATFVTLLFTPALYLAGESIRRRLDELAFWRTRKPSEQP